MYTSLWLLKTWTGSLFRPEGKEPAPCTSQRAAEPGRQEPSTAAQPSLPPEHLEARTRPRLWKVLDHSHSQGPHR